MTTVIGPDGASIEFGDDVPHETIKSVMQKHYGNTASPTAMSWADVGSQAQSNLASSGGQFLSGMGNMVMHPITTGQNLGKVVAGGVEHLIPGQHYPQEAYADAVAKFYKDRYGSVEGFKKAIATDPVGVAADVSLPLTMGTSAVAELPGTIGRLGRIAGEASRVVDPIGATVDVGSKAGALTAPKAGYLASEIVGLRTGVGGQSPRAIAQAGYEGGPAAEAVEGSLRGTTPIETPANEARSAVSKMYEDRGKAYAEGSEDFKADKTILDFKPIDDAVANVSNIRKFEGIDTSKPTAKVRQDIGDMVDLWKSGDPSKFHTIEGLDELKKSIGEIKDSQEYGSPQWKVANEVYNGVRGAITKQSPGYAKVMEAYGESTKNIKELQKTFSLGRNATNDTAMRKLQSAMRNNVNTDFGERTRQLQILSNAGAKNLPETLAGQSMNSWSPRGINRMVASHEAGLALATALLHHPLVAGAMIGDLGLQSPRLMGEAALAGGKAARHAENLAKRIPFRKALRAAYAVRGAQD